ncbi:MAG: hypothetical protein ACRD2G_03490 [Terriglobia bacterium]
MRSKFILAGISVLLALALVLPLYRPAPVHALSRQAVPSTAARCSNLAPREVDFPYYSLKDGFESTLMLVSDSPKPVDLTIAIRGLRGKMLLTGTTIQPQAKLAIDLASTITKLGGDPESLFAEGSVSVYFMGTIMPVVGQMTVTNPVLGLTHQVDMVENDPGRSDIPPVLNGVWWGFGGGDDATVAVSNTSDKSIFADVYLDFQDARHALNTPLLFAPGETKVLDVAKLLASIGANPAGVPEGGITIVQRGPNPALIASGKITDPASGFSSTMDFPDPELQHLSALHATGLPIGTPTADSPYAGAGTFVPHVVVRNLSSATQTVTLTVEYPQPAFSGGARPSMTDALGPMAADGKPSSPVERVIWSSLPVPGYTTEDYSLAAVMSQLPLPLPFCSIRVQYSGQAGSMIAEISSVDPYTDFVVDARPQNEGNRWAGSGGNPWHLDKVNYAMYAPPAAFKIETNCTP